MFFLVLDVQNFDCGEVLVVIGVVVVLYVVFVFVDVDFFVVFVFDYFGLYGVFVGVFVEYGLFVVYEKGFEFDFVVCFVLQVFDVNYVVF